MERTWIGSAPPNFSAGRPVGCSPVGIVIHIIVGSLKSAGYQFQNPSSQVSAHYGIGRAGEVHQFVRETDTAFHAGILSGNNPPSLVRDRAGVNPNFYTIGIEHEGFPEDPWSAAMYGASGALVREIAWRWNIPLDADHVLLHREIRVSKSCPGVKVHKDELLRLALAVPVPCAGYRRSLRTLTGVNLRRKGPATFAPALRIIPAGTQLEVEGFTDEGEMVKGNRFWYRDLEGNYLWAGATDHPDPLSA